MCGIICYVGDKDASKVGIECLKKLEYRGYDSWGCAAKGENEIYLVKKPGKIGLMNEELNIPRSGMAVLHTRWATCGGVTQENAHPHLSCDKEIAVVHNGIVENYQKLRNELKSKGHAFTSETDTEVIPHLIEENMKHGMSFTGAFRKAMRSLDGRFAVVALHNKSSTLLAARRGSPLIIGVGENEFFISSDIPAFLEHTNKVVFLEDNEMALVNSSLEIHDMNSFEVKKKEISKIDWKIEQADKGKYDHFMLKEILEQRFTISKAIESNVNKIEEIAKMISEAKGTFFVGCGTAGKVAKVGTYLFSRIAEKHVNSSIGSEFPNYNHFVKPETLLIAISQSGETADTLEAIEAAKKKGAKIVSIVNVQGSTMTRLSDNYILVNSGPEKCVASTKVTTAQIAVLTALAYAVAGKLKKGLDLLNDTQNYVAGMLNQEFIGNIKLIADKIKDKESLYIIGRGLNHPMALESAIKMQEVPYIHAEGFAGGELKHGPLALITDGVPLIVLIANDETKEETISNALEVKARGGFVIGISPEENEAFDFFIKVPDVGNCSPIVNIIAVQLLSYYAAVLKGQNPDYLRNLAKSVTVK